jgi:hypothetical protein
MPQHVFGGDGSPTTDFGDDKLHVIRGVVIGIPSRQLTRICKGYYVKLVLNIWNREKMRLGPFLS